MLLDKNPRAGFLSPPAPAGAARPRADFPGFPARRRRSSEEEDRWAVRSRTATEVRSRMAFVRLREAEWVGLKQLAVVHL